MAVESFSRWHIFREITLQKRSGILTLQIGRNYVSWNIHSANIVAVSSTLHEYTFSHFLLRHGIAEESLSRSAKLVTEYKTLGAVLVEHQMMSAEEVRNALSRHAVLTAELLFHGANVFWNAGAVPFKRSAVALDLPFNEALLRCDRGEIETHCVLRMVNEFRPPFRIVQGSNPGKTFNALEKRVLAHLHSSASLKEILRDPELDTFTCYRTLFLLWIAGQLQDARDRTTARKKQVRQNWTNRIRTIPPDWIFPLIAGSLIGAILVPSPPPKDPPPSAYRLEPLQKALERPTWKDAEEKDGEEKAIDKNK